MVPMPKDVTSCTMTTSVGTYTFDPVSKQLKWDVGKIQPLKVPTMRGTVSRSSTVREIIIYYYI